MSERCGGDDFHRETAQHCRGVTDTVADAARGCIALQYNEHEVEQPTYLAVAVEPEEACRQPFPRFC